MFTNKYLFIKHYNYGKSKIFTRIFNEEYVRNFPISEYTFLKIYSLYSYIERLNIPGRHFAYLYNLHLKINGRKFAVNTNFSF